MNSNNKEVINGYVANDKGGKKIRYYDFDHPSLCERKLQFTWYVSGEERNVAFTTDANGNIEIVGNKPSDKDLKKNKDVRIIFGGKELSLADAIKKISKMPKSKVNEVSQESIRPYKCSIL
ncbi:hypothetical protein [Wolbachia endosymbiont of Ctenocephalides felis wCfeT]|uniref:hypothetical protein n=1 Tax=Wolbachia endosymbiont of Ctenocephalides felis wCfeT TaxID=2732593 RepID=UPI001447A1B9|nr:hypothetical protein [Wolbachia endosymbiont of Ctenocephalides felis wCfeT]